MFDVTGLGRAVAILVTIAVGVGCGARDDAPEDGKPLMERPPERAVADVVRDLQQAFADGEPTAICDRLTRRAKIAAGSAAHASPTTCPQDVRRRLGEIRAGGGWRHSGEARVVGVRVAGSRATATIARTVGAHTDLPLSREGGRWKLDSFFGNAPDRHLAFATELTSRSFPSSYGADGVRATRNEAPCPPMSMSHSGAVAGGCVIEGTSTSRARLRIATAFGEFDLSDCTIEMRTRVDARGRTWTDNLAFRREPGDPMNACGDIYRCPLDDRGVESTRLAPLPGRIVSDGTGGYLQRVDVCLETCIGDYLGELQVTLDRDDSAWKARAADAPVGSSGLRVDAAFELDAGELRLQPLASGS
jgi:hypothetical protein